MDTTQTSDGAARLSDAQRSVQRKLGRCMLRLQQYETLLKRVLPYSSFSGEPSQLPAQLAATSKSIESKTMGSLIGMLTKTYLRPNSSVIANDTPPDLDSMAWFSSRTQIAFDVECYEAIKQNLKDLVDLRNELVHHFLAKHDVGHIEGCTAAEEYLDKSYQSIDAHLTTLRHWAETMRDVQELTASFAQSRIFQDILLDGISPDGAVHWSISGIVQGLRDAEADLALNGWTCLSAAIAWLGQHAPEQVPGRYGCSTWKQVLHESRQFEFRKQSLQTKLESQRLTGTAVLYRSRRRPFEG